MFKVFTAFVKKEIFHIVRDTRTLYILFGMPLVLVLIFGFTISNEFKGASLTVYNAANDELSKNLVEKIKSSGHFNLVSNTHSISQLEEEFKAGTVKIGLVIPPNFELDFRKNKSTSIQIITDATEPNYATTLTSYASRMIKQFQLEHSGLQQVPFSISIETRMLYNPKLLGAYNFVPGVVALILMLTCAMMTSLTIAREKELGTMDLLLVSPLPPLLIIIGKVTPYAILSFISAVMVFILGYLVFDVPVIGSIGLLLASTFLYLVVALSLGVFISTKAKSQQVAMVVSMFALMLPTMLLSGFIFPIESMPDVLQFISRIVPAKYFILVEKSVMLKGAGLLSVYKQILVLFLMLFILLIATYKNFKVVYNK